MCWFSLSKDIAAIPESRTHVTVHLSLSSEGAKSRSVQEALRRGTHARPCNGRTRRVRDYLLTVRADYTRFRKIPLYAGLPKLV